MAFNQDRETQSSTNRMDTDAGSVTPISDARTGSVTPVSEPRTAGVYEAKETTGEQPTKTGIYDQPEQKSGSMFSKLAIVAAVIIVAVIVFEILF